MEIVKKNLISIICGVIAVATLIAVFVWPLDGLFETLKGKATARAQLVSKVTTLRNRPRVVPTIDPNTQKVQQLRSFPSKEIIKRGEDAQKLMQKESVAMYDLAWKLNQQGHDLVVPNSLPEPATSTISFNFRTNLEKAFEKLRTEDLASGIPPTPDQLKLRAAALEEEIRKKETITLADGTVTNEDAVKAHVDAEIAKLPDIMKKEMATKNKMYIDPATVFVVSSSLPPNTNATPTAMWWAQVNYWVSNDVASAIEELNANSTNVLDSPIKNLISLSIPEDFYPPTKGAGNLRGAADPEAPTVATGGRPDATIALPDPGNSTPTKRASNNLYDVVQFNLVVDMEANKIPLFLKTLATNRFLTVTRVEMEPVDSQLKQLEGYVYGPQPVVTLKLDCEELFMREWTIHYMPKDVRKTLGIPDVTAKP